MRHLLITIVTLALSGCIFQSSGTSDNNTVSSNNGTNNTSQNTSNSSTSGTNSTTGNTTNLCGNGRLDLGETCDPCDDYVCPSGGCGLFVQTGSAETCDIACEPNGQVSACANGDGCCPDFCNPNNDNDCSANCGNNVVDVDETCDPCEPCPPANACSPVRETGDASTCTLVCETAPAPPECCGDQICPDGAVCQQMVCVQGAETCDQKAAPNVYCVAQLGPGATCDLQNKRCVSGATGICVSDGDCLPWEACGVGSCEARTSCYPTNSAEYCAHEDWGNGANTSCAMVNNNYACTQGLPRPCTDRSTCQPWLSCDGGSCVKPDNCNDAKDPQTFCIFQKEKLMTMCRADGSCQ